MQSKAVATQVATASTYTTLWQHSLAENVYIVFIARPVASMSPMLYTIGHSTRPLSELVAMLKDNGVKLLVDVRTVPKSHTNPQARPHRHSMKAC